MLDWTATAALGGKAFVTVPKSAAVGVMSRSGMSSSVSTQCTCARLCCGCSMRIRCASMLERLMKSSPKIKVPCGQHSGRAGSKSNLWVPALETQPQPKRRGQGTAKQKITLTQLTDEFKQQLRVTGCCCHWTRATICEFQVINKRNQKLNPNVHLQTSRQRHPS